MSFLYFFKVTYKGQVWHVTEIKMNPNRCYRIRREEDKMVTILWVEGSQCELIVDSEGVLNLYGQVS